MLFFDSLGGLSRGRVAYICPERQSLLIFAHSEIFLGLKCLPCSCGVIYHVGLSIPVQWFSPIRVGPEEVYYTKSL